MGKRGPRPLPTAYIRQSSNSWRGRTNQEEPKPPLGRPACPKWLDKEAKKAWRKLVPRLELMGVLTVVDGNALTRYCQTWSRWIAAQQFIQRYGETYTIKRSDGNIALVLPWPHSALTTRLGTELLRLEQEFGLTPSSRTRIRVDIRAFLRGVPARMCTYRPSSIDSNPDDEARRRFLAGGGPAPSRIPSGDPKKDEALRRLFEGGGPAPPRPWPPKPKPKPKRRSKRQTDSDAPGQEPNGESAL